MNKIYTRLINREHPLPEEYIPSELVDIRLPFDSLPGAEKRLLEAYTVAEEKPVPEPLIKEVI